MKLQKKTNWIGWAWHTMLQGHLILFSSYLIYTHIQQHIKSFLTHYKFLECSNCIHIIWVSRFYIHNRQIANTYLSTDERTALNPLLINKVYSIVYALWKFLKIYNVTYFFPTLFRIDCLVQEDFLSLFICLAINFYFPYFLN